MGNSFKYFLIIISLIIIFFSLKSLKSKKSLLKNKKVKSVLTNLLILTISLIVIFTIFEVFLQITAPKACRQPDDILHHSYQPGCEYNHKTIEWNTKIKINSDGLRDDEIQEKDKLRVLMLGGSFTRGYGVEQNETFSELLQKKADIDVINTGVTSYSPILEYLYLKEKGLSYQPDIVILNFDMSDVNSDYLYEKTAEFDNNIITQVKPEKKTLLITLYTNIKTIKFIESILIKLDSLFPSKTEINTLRQYDPKYDKYAITRNETLAEAQQEHWDRTLKYISLINKLCKENNITFILSIYPYGHQTSKDAWHLGRHNFGFTIGKIYSNNPEKILETYSIKNNIHFITMFPQFQSSNQTLFFPYDGHFNQNGHELAADILYSELNDNFI
jgi:hypothetical protein